MSAIAINLKYLRGRPLSYLDYSNYNKNSAGGYTVLLISEFKNFRSFSRLNSGDFIHKYGLIIVD